MEIRKSAWHHRFYTFGFETYSETYQPVNLCSYFWRIVAGLCKSLLIAAVALGLLTVAVYALYTYPVVVSAATGLVVAIIVISSNWIRIKNFLCRTKVTSEPGLLRSYLKAKKDKVCPLITFVE